MKNTEMPRRLTNLADTFSSLCRSHGLIAVFAFGSRECEIEQRLRGVEPAIEYPESDLDLGVLPPQGAKLDVTQIVRFAISIEDLFRVPRADIVDLRKAPPYLALDAIRGHQVYCDDDFEVANFELFVLRRAGDLAYHERQRRRMLLTPVDGEASRSTRSRWPTT